MKRKSNWRPGTVVLLALCLIGVWIVQGNRAQAKEEKAEDFQYELSYGYDNHVKYNRLTRVRLTLANPRDHFEGHMEIILPRYENRNIMYQKEVRLAAGETKHLYMDVPISYNDGRGNFRFKIVDKSGKARIDKTVAMNGLEEGAIPFVGVLTDDYPALTYLKNADATIFPLKTEQMPKEAAGLDSLDVIIINNYDTSQLSREQYEALKQWTAGGGSLVLGTGTMEDKVFSVFEDGFLKGTIGEVDEEGILDISLMGGIPITKEDKLYHQMVYWGQGNIQVISYDLGIENQEKLSGGRNLMEVILANLSESRKSLLEDPYMFSGRSSMENVLSIADSSKYPSVGRYMGILGTYILLAGPGLYFILKKKDKRNLMWVMVPALSLCFCLGIYFMGTDTRINQPYMSYASYFTINDKNAENVSEHTWFSVTSPSNKEYQVTVDGSYLISDGGYNIGYSYDSNRLSQKLDSYEKAIKEKGDRTVLEINNNTAFESMPFEALGNITLEGGYDYDLKLDGMELKGTFTNNLGYPIYNALIYSGNILTSVGDLEDGKNDIAKGADSYPVTKWEDLDLQEVLPDLLNIYPYNNDYPPQKLRQYFAMENYLYSHVPVSGNQGFLLGFVDMDQTGSFMESIDLNKTGVQLVVIPLTIPNFYNGDAFIPDIWNYCTNREELDAYNRYIQSEATSLYFDFGEEDIKSLYYLQKWNYYPQSNWSVFIGEIWAYNVVNETYEKLLDSEEYGIEIPVGDYLNEENQMELQIKVSSQDLQDETLIMPLLSVTKEVK